MIDVKKINKFTFCIKQYFFDCANFISKLVHISGKEILVGGEVNNLNGTGSSS
jgi:hypothetical protein